MADNYSDVPWKSEDGRIECQDTICPPGLCGSGKCPIDLQTEAATCMQMGDFAKAFQFLHKAITIEPRFAAAWCNIGACLGNLGDHEHARDAFQIALQIRGGNYPQAEQGLAVSERKLGGAGGAYTDVRYMDVVDDLLERAVEIGEMKEKVLKNVPELMPYANGLGQRLFNRFQEEETDTIDSILGACRMTLIWSILTGMGAVLEWNRDWNELKSKGVLEKLCEARGLGAMDEYVIGLLTGERYDTEQGIEPESCQAVVAKVQGFSSVAFKKILAGCKGKDEDAQKSYAKNCISEIAKGCYLFGNAWMLEMVM